MGQRRGPPQGSDLKGKSDMNLGSARGVEPIHLPQLVNSNQKFEEKAEPRNLLMAASQMKHPNYPSSSGSQKMLGQQPSITISQQNKTRKKPVKKTQGKNTSHNQ
mmetsp:Transcript_1765/g.2276  ORF Transcript_1765/g.2276 Transcript_1765/m.2276 type:complete len:105 (+) Transcript_1765:912-1226(+)